MSDYLVKSLVYDGAIRAYAVDATETVGEAQKVLDFEKLDDLEALKPHIDQAKNYFEELKATILHPTIGEIKYKMLGIINFIVIGLLFSLTFSRLLGVMLKGIYGAVNQFTNMFGFGHSSYGSSSISAFPMFWLFLLAIFLTQRISANFKKAEPSKAKTKATMPTTTKTLNGSKIWSKAFLKLAPSFCIMISNIQ